MNIGIILSGGVGSRINSIDIPKQYFTVGDKMLIEHSIQKFIQHKNIDTLVIVCAKEWETGIEEKVRKYNLENKKVVFARQGNSRQESVLNGMNAVATKCDRETRVVIHDAARPFVTMGIISKCIEECHDCLGVMPALKVKDTIYEVDGCIIAKPLNRDLLVAGQSPECFRFIDYLNLFKNMTTKELGEIKGSSEVVVRSGEKIKVIDGDENNFKITTNLDIEKYCSIILKDE